MSDFVSLLFHVSISEVGLSYGLASTDRSISFSRCSFRLQLLISPSTRLLLRSVLLASFPPSGRLALLHSTLIKHASLFPSFDLDFLHWLCRDGRRTRLNRSRMDVSTSDDAMGTLPPHSAPFLPVPSLGQLIFHLYQWLRWSFDKRASRPFELNRDAISFPLSISSSRVPFNESSKHIST